MKNHKKRNWKSQIQNILMIDGAKWRSLALSIVTTPPPHSVESMCLDIRARVRVGLVQTAVQLVLACCAQDTAAVSGACDTGENTYRASCVNCDRMPVQRLSIHTHSHPSSPGRFRWCTCLCMPHTLLIACIHGWCSTGHRGD